ncbi:MAG: hypothetical protein E7536_08945 [Ruminococcaceae bacterium]|nr:hypothetical protein [Oscillospiraceae bacterium]
MTYNEMINAELEELGLKTRIVSLPKEMRLNADDFMILDSYIAHDVAENEDMLARSEFLASRCSLR